MAIKRPTRTGRRSFSASPKTASNVAGLRLTGGAGTADNLNRPISVIGEPITGPADPRWVLAVRTAEQLQGTVLTPERREKLLRVGKMMGLTLFDCNLVIAIVQDQARRGYAPEYCPTAGEAQLALVPRSRFSGLRAPWRGRRAMATAALIVGIIAVELAVLKLLFL